jgi:carbon-monoxide dehydrogenase small subunit
LWACFRAGRERSKERGNRQGVEQLDGEFRFQVNGEARTYRGDPMARLLDVLRYGFRLTGTKEGCGEGECGACTVLLDGEVVCACLVPVFQTDGAEVVTVEGLANDDRLDPIQQAFVDEGGVQCGACTPGMLVAARAMLDKFPSASRETVRVHLAGNLCRCTGYEAIYRSVEKVVLTNRGEGVGGEGG